jgi:RecA/RadA recombinase
LASQKGGSGKTTLSGHLAVQAQRAGAGPVVLIDIDPQGSLADWWNEREAEYPAFAQTTVARLANDLQVLRQQGFKLAVIDTPPAITMAIQSVISVAEIGALWRYIADRLEKNFRRTVFAPAPANGAAQQMGGVPRPAGGFGRRVAQ